MATIVLEKGFEGWHASGGVFDRIVEYCAFRLEPGSTLREELIDSLIYRNLKVVNL